MAAKKRVTIYDIAKRAGVSYQTVSRVINHSPNVKEVTRQKVDLAITELNYRPNLAARSLPGRRSFVIGFVAPYDPDYLIRDPNLLAQISGADAEADEHGYSLLLSTAGNSANGLNAYKRFARHLVADGALVVETATREAGTSLLKELDCPYVYLGYDPGNPDAYAVHPDDFHGSCQVARYLLEKGHRRIGIINGPPMGAVGAMQGRLDGYQQVLAEAGYSFEPGLMVYGDYTRRSGEVAARQLWALSEPPTAIFALNDRMAMGAIQFLQAKGLRVPEDVAVVGFDDIPAAADFNPPLTTVRQPSREIGQVAARLLFARINGEAIDEKQIILESELVIRKSS